MCELTQSDEIELNRRVGDLNWLVESYYRKRSDLLEMARHDAVKWCQSPGVVISGKTKLSDQTWIKAFAVPTRTIDATFAGHFLSTFGLSRAKWDKDSVARHMRRVDVGKSDSVVARIITLADKLKNCIGSESAGLQVSAASKIMMFAMPQDKIFIWDSKARMSANLRIVADCYTNQDAAHCSELKRRFRKTDEKNYRDFYEYCDMTLEAEKQQRDFKSALVDFQSCMQTTEGPLSSDEFVASDFYARRLLDKLMYWEGRWISNAAMG